MSLLSFKIIQILIFSTFHFKCICKFSSYLNVLHNIYVLVDDDLIYLLFLLIFNLFNVPVTRHVSKDNSVTKQNQHSWYDFLLAGCVAGILGTAMGIMVIGEY